MLEFKSYKVNELKEMFHINRTFNLERSLNTYGVEFTKSGSGENTTYTITAINDELKIFCITFIFFIIFNELPF